MDRLPVMAFLAMNQPYRGLFAGCGPKLPFSSGLEGGAWAGSLAGSGPSCC